MKVGPRMIALGIISTVFLSATYVYAQTSPFDNIFGEGSDLTITMTPNYPQPGDVVHLSAKSSTLDLSQAAISWTANGRTLKSATNNSEIDVPAGNLGTETDLTITATAADGGSGTASVSIIPTQVDLLYDANSYVPPFYQGRALPSAGTSLRAQAIVHFKRADGTLVPSSNIVYTWRKNGLILGDLSGRGKSAATIPAPTLYGTDTISVTAISTDKTLSGFATTQIPSIEPVLMVYQDHPLFGIMYYDALSSQNAIPDTEMSFAAVPYFAQASNPNDPNLIYNWKVNGSVIPLNVKNPSEITINADKSDGNAAVQLEATHATNYFMDSKGSWSMTFSNSTSFTASAGAGANDAFHNGQ